MLIHPVVERLRALGLAAVADTLIELQSNPQAAAWLGLLMDREVTFRDNRRLSRRLAAAKLRQTATIENIDYRTARLDRALFQALTTSQWARIQPFRQDAASIDRPCARRPQEVAVGKEECPRRGRTKEWATKKTGTRGRCSKYPSDVLTQRLSTKLASPLTKPPFPHNIKNVSRGVPS